MASITGKKVSFEWKGSGAREVLLAADFTQWQLRAIPLVRQRTGSWKATVTLPPGQYQYRFLVDGVWCDDPACTARVSNEFGGENCVKTVPAAAARKK